MKYRYIGAGIKQGIKHRCVVDVFVIKLVFSTIFYFVGNYYLRLNEVIFFYNILFNWELLSNSKVHN